MTTVTLELFDISKKIITIVILTISLASCIPPGKLSEALDANIILSSKYDTLINRMSNTVGTR